MPLCFDGPSKLFGHLLLLLLIKDVTSGSNIVPDTEQQQRTSSVSMMSRVFVLMGRKGVWYHGDRTGLGPGEPPLTGRKQIRVPQPLKASSLFWLGVVKITAWACLISHTELSWPSAPRHPNTTDGQTRNHHKSRVDKTVETRRGRLGSTWDS